MHLGRCIFLGAAWLATQWCESSMSTFPSGPLRLRCDASAMALAAVSVLVIYANFCRVWPKIGTLNSPKWMVSHTLSSVWHRHLIHGDLGIPQRNPHLTCHFWFHDPTSQEALTEAAASSLAERLGRRRRRRCHGFVRFHGLTLKELQGETVNCKHYAFLPGFHQTEIWSDLLKLPSKISNRSACCLYVSIVEVRT